MNLVAELDAFDGKRTDVLERLAVRLPRKAAVIRDLLAVAGKDEAKYQAAATWLLKRFSENGVSYSPTQAEGLIDLLDRVTHWEARLHLLQLLPGLTIPANRKARLHRVLRGLLADPNKFVRAWSYNGLSVLAAQYPGFHKDALKLLAKGQREEAPSVQARIRNIFKSAEWRDRAEPA